MNWFAFLAWADGFLWLFSLLYPLYLDGQYTYATRKQKRIAWTLVAAAALIACILAGMRIQ